MLILRRRFRFSGRLIAFRRRLLSFAFRLPPPRFSPPSFAVIAADAATMLPRDASY